MKRNKLVVFVLVVVLVLGALAPVTAQEKVVNIALPQEADTLLPPYTTMTFAGYAYQLFLEGAWAFDQELNPVPKLVTEIPSVENGGISEDGSVITLTLKEGLVWSDGDPLTSADFVFTYEMLTDENNAVITRAPYDVMASVEAPDETTVVVTFEEPYAPWLGRLFTYVLPEHVLRPVFDAEGTLDNAEFAFAPTVASGPLVLESWDVGNFMRFVPNENYHDGAPVVDAVIVTFVPDDQAYLATFTSGSADIGTFLPFDQIPTLEASGFVEVELLPSGYNEGWFFNVREGLGHPALQDLRVRQAIALGFDADAITEDLLLGRTYPAVSYWENTPYASPNLQPVGYDPDRAELLLDEAGWVDSNGDGTRDQDGVELVLRFVTNTRQIRQDVQVVAQQQLGEIGIGIEIQTFPSDVYFNSYSAGGPIALGDYDIGEWSSSPAFPDPDVSRFLCAEIPSEENPAGNNWSGICNEELDDLFAQQRTIVDTNERIAVFHQIDELLYSEYVWIGIWHDPDVWVRGTRLLNTALNGVTPFWNIHEWDVTN